MPNRILKESICTSENIEQLTPFQETMFYRLIVNCDDYGRMDARPKILTAKLFPLKDIRTNQIIDGLQALASAELVILYEIDGKPFLQMKTWERHQQIRAKKSKYHSPESGTISSDSICNQMKSDDSKCSRNPIQSNIESNPNPNPTPNDAKRGGIGYMRRYIAELTDKQYQELISMMDDLGPNADELIEYAVDEACDAGKTSRNWKYVRKVLNTLIEEGITTRAQATDAKRRKDTDVAPPPDRAESGQYYEEW